MKSTWFLYRSALAVHQPSFPSTESHSLPCSSSAPPILPPNIHNTNRLNSFMKAC